VNHSPLPLAIIVDAGARDRRLDARASRPRSLLPLGASDRSALDWLVHACAATGIEQTRYVGGYHIEKVIERFPELPVRYTPEPDGLTALLTSGVLREEPARPLLIVAADTVLLPAALKRMPGGGMRVGTYGVDLETTPLVLVWLPVTERHTFAARIEAAVRTGAEGGLLGAILGSGAGGVEFVDVDGLAAPLDDGPAIARTVFHGKAGTLDNLAPLALSARIAPRERFTAADWRHDHAGVLARLREQLPVGPLVVRSSAAAEDRADSSGAGRFLTVADVDGADEQAVSAAVDAVVASYGSGGRALHGRDEVLIQQQITGLKCSGVLLTRDPRSGAPYFVLNRDSVSGRSDVVTSGSAPVEALFAAWSAPSEGMDADSARILALGRELMDVTRLDSLDVEWAITNDDECHLFQVRPLTTGLPEAADEDVLGVLTDAHTFVNGRMAPRPGLAGASTVLGTMPDWNPAEMLGTTPRPLALSLYQRLIGDDAWAEARASLGYRDVTPEPLVLSVAGRPYVDVRSSLNSFLPDGLADPIAEAWVDACIARLRRDPALHDKVEFELAVTCLSPNWDADRSRLLDAGLSVGDADTFGKLLGGLTTAAVGRGERAVDDALALVDRLARRPSALRPQTPPVGPHEPARRLRHQLADCRRFGTIPFAVLARYAFIGLTMLRGLRDVEAIDDDRYEAFLRAVPTVASGLTADVAAHSRGEVALDDLVERYGHLRPNSYEVTSPNYRSDPKRFLAAVPPGSFAEIETGDPIGLLSVAANRVEPALRAVGLDVDAPTLARFIVASVGARERAKFEFMKSVDAMLECAVELGEALGLDRDQVSFLSVDELLRLETDSASDATRSHLARTSNLNEKRWRVSRALRLPDLLREADDVLQHVLEAWRANFVTRLRTIAEPCWLDDEPEPRIEGRIVVVRSADPGYDWIFGHGIAGLITQYGGAASHMAIRAAEFGLPAAIGCGEATIESLRGAGRIELDCAAETVRGLA